MSKAASLVIELRKRGVELSVDASGGASYRGPKGAITPELRGQLAIHRPAVVELLQLEVEFLSTLHKMADLLAAAEALEARGEMERAVERFAEFGDLVEKMGTWSPIEMRLRILVGKLWPEYWARIPVAVQRELVSVG